MKFFKLFSHALVALMVVALSEPIRATASIASDVSIQPWLCNNSGKAIVEFKAHKGDSTIPSGTPIALLVLAAVLIFLPVIKGRDSSVLITDFKVDNIPVSETTRATGCITI